MNSILRKVLLSIIGVISIILAIKCYTFQELDYAYSSIYGGDAFTGIQNAAAKTSRNVKELADIIKFGLGSILMIMGLISLSYGLTQKINQKNNTDSQNLNTQIISTLPTEEK